MRQQFHFLHLDYSESLCEYTLEQLEKSGRHLLKDGNFQVFYSKNKHGFCHVEVHVESAWGHYQASNEGHDFYQVVDGVAEKLEKQFKKTKDKHQKHRKAS